MKSFERVFPWIVVGVAAIFFATRLFPSMSASGQMDLHAFAAIPAQDNGRYKPIDTFARTRLMSLSHRQTVTYEKEKDNPETSITISADHWLLDVMAIGLIAYYNTVQIDDPDILMELKLEPRRDHRYEKADLEEHFETILQKDLGARKKDEKQLTPTDYQWLVLASHVKKTFTKAYAMQAGLRKQGSDPDNMPLFQNPDKMPLFRIENQDVIAMLGLETRPGLRYSFNEIRNHKNQDFFLQFLKKAAELGLARERGDKIDDLVDVKTLELYQQLKTYFDLVQLGGSAGLIPVPGRKWLTLGEALDQMDKTGQEIPEATTLSNILYAYAVNEPATFNKEVVSYRQMLAQQYPTETKKSGFELFFNDFDPFYLCTIFYVLIFVISSLSWFGWTGTLQRTAFSLAVLVVLVHTWALCARMYILGRPPVTNLYSSAVFIGWGCAVLCLVLEWIYHNGFGLLVASMLGFMTLLVAMHLDGGDTLEVLVAVLDTNFWLATHVVCVTMGYTATFVAGFWGIKYIFFGLCTPKLDKVASRNMANAIYGVVCFATLLSFVGTVLGGIWADQSWGRFWGWDPKENGAVLIVIWNALILHSRWAGLVKDRGLAVLAVAGNMVVAWSWFGTNQLGVGLHNYGFNKTLAQGLVVFWATQVLVIIAGCIPLRYWRSFNVRPPIPAKLPKVDMSKVSRRLRPA